MGELLKTPASGTRYLCESTSCDAPTCEFGDFEGVSAAMRMALSKGSVWSISFLIQMMMLSIDLDNFKFDVEPISRLIEEEGCPYMDWLTVKVKITEGDFSGMVRWLVMPMEIEKFRKDLSQVYQSLIAGRRDVEPIELSGIEPHFSLTLELANAWGHLFAQYTMKDSPDGPELKGSFGLDQSVLPQWIRDMDELLEFRGQ